MCLRRGEERKWASIGCRERNCGVGDIFHVRSCYREEHIANGFHFTAYYIAFGEHGPRAATPPGEGWKVAGYTGLGVVVSFLLFWAVRMGAGPAPGTMNKEYQEATNEYLKVRLTSQLFLLLYLWFGISG